MNEKIRECLVTSGRVMGMAGSFVLSRVGTPSP